MRTKLRLLIALLTFALVAAMPLSQAWASSGDLDEILAYDITVDVNEDATLNMVYHIEWKVLDSTSDGPLSWVRVGIPNRHYNEMVGLNDTVKRISYDSSNGSYARIDLDRKYYAGEVASFDFKLVQDYMYQVGRDNQGEAVFEFTPGWFDDIEVDSLTIKWKSDKVDRIAPAALQSKGYYTWETSLRKGGRYTVTVAYPDDAFDFDINKTIENGMTKGSYDDEEDFSYILYAITFSGLFFVMIVWIIRVLRGIALAVVGLFEGTSGFTTGKTEKKITRTKVVYYPTCPGCGAARSEGKDTCEYCGRSLVKSEEVVSEEDIPAEEQSLKRKDTDGEYAYSTLPDTFLRVHVVPVPVVSHSSSRHRSSGSSRSCACASSCACACGCACACACAGGGRAGCTTKDFYRTDLKLSQLERSASAGENR